MKKIKAIPLIMAGLLLSGCSENVIEETDPMPVTSEKETASEPLHFTAGDDYYGYINYDRLDGLEIGFGKSSAGSFDEAMDYVDGCVREIITELNESGRSYPAGSNEQLVRDYYGQIMDFDVTPDSRADFFEDCFNAIDGAENIPRLMEVYADLVRETGVTVFLSLDSGFDHSGSGKNTLRLDLNIMPMYCCNLDDLLKSGYAGAATASSVKELLTYLGTSEDEAEQRAKNVVYMLMDISRPVDWEAFRSPEHEALYKPCSMAELSAIFTNADIGAFFERCGGKLPDTVSIADRDAFSALNAALTEENLQALKDALTVSFLGEYGEYLPDKYKSIRAKYFPMPRQFRETLAFEMVSNDLYYEIGELYADRYGDEKTAEAARLMCEDMRDSYRELIKGSRWLSDEGKAQCLDKLEKMGFVIGRGKPAYDPQTAAGLIGETLLDTKVNINSAEIAAMFAKMGKQWDSGVMEMAPHTVNACYSSCNTVYIPYGILNKPFFDADATEAANLGAIGSIIAHEMSHAFDSNNIAFDADGAYDPERIPQSDRDAFERKMEATKAYYSRFRVVNVYSVDGELTLGENFADLGGMECIISAVDTMAEKKELLESYAGIWCSLEITRDAILQLRSDCHSPASVRVNAVVSSCDAFYDIYGIKEGDAMYISPEERVSRW